MVQKQNEGKLAASRLDWKLENLFSVLRKWKSFSVGRDCRDKIWFQMTIPKGQCGFIVNTDRCGEALDMSAPSQIFAWHSLPDMPTVSLGCLIFFHCKTAIYRFASYFFRILPLMPQKKKAKRPKREHGDAERKMKGRKNLKMIVSVVVMEASWYCATGSLVLKLIISPVLVW